MSDTSRKVVKGDKKTSINWEQHRALLTAVKHSYSTMYSYLKFIVLTWRCILLWDALDKTWVNTSVGILEEVSEHLGYVKELCEKQVTIYTL